MTPTRALLTVVFMTLGGAALGAGIGVALGYFVPGYYRAVIVGGADASFDAVAVGLGLGLTQGTILGFIGSLVLVVAFMWFESRRERHRAGGGFPVVPVLPPGALPGDPFRHNQI